MSQELVQRGKDTPATALQKFLTTNVKQLQMALPMQLRERPDRFIRLATTALVTTPTLQNCNMLSICNSVMLAAQLGLEPNNGLGHGWMIPYGRVCTFQPGYRGLLDLGYRAKSFKAAQPIVIYDGDEWDYREGASLSINHVPVNPSRRKRFTDAPEDWAWIAAYSRVILEDGYTDMLWMWREEIEAVKNKSSKAGDNSPWAKWFWEMVKKTPVKRHMKFLRLSPEAGTALGIDDQAEAYGASDRKQTSASVAQDMVLDSLMEEQALEIGYEVEQPPDVAAQNAILDEGLAKAGKSPKDIPPRAGTLSAIKGYRAKLGDPAWYGVLGSNGFENPAQIQNEEIARKIKAEMAIKESEL